MTGQLATIYQETMHAQTALVELWPRVAAGTAAPADWNAAEECLDAALERFRTYRLQEAPPSSSNWRSPGLAGGQVGASGGSGAVFRPAVISKPASGEI